MSGSKEHEKPTSEPAKEGEPHKVDQKTQEEAGKERAKSGGYD